MNTFLICIQNLKYIFLFFSILGFYNDQFACQNFIVVTSCNKLAILITK